jgi:cytochrome c-type biogenesis protein CcsB
MFSAWFGVAVGLVLEFYRSRGIFGAGASFVGWLALGALFVAPFVFGREIGGEIGQVNGVLMSYWLYIHVTAVTASYSLIGTGFLLSVWWLIRYYRNEKQMRGVSGYRLSADVADPELRGGAIVLQQTWIQTLAGIFFVPRSPELAVAQVTSEPIERNRVFLANLDACNLVVLQLAFWVLGSGIIFGAIWADQSWGRPWGWDPKETFALVTWIVYLIVVHVRVATEHKAWWTAVLSVIGFFIMLFNWIGVNFFLVGLHSYA